METRVKERLIGALILIALIVLLVPELLTGPHPARGSGANAGAMQTYTIDLAAPSSQAAPARIQQAPPEPAVPANKQPTATISVEPVPEPAPAPAPEKPTSQKSPAAASSTDSAAGATESEWIVQLGSFASDANARRLTDQLKARGYKAFVSRIDSGSRTRYRVRVGPEQERAQAENLAARLRRDGHSPVIVSSP